MPKYKIKGRPPKYNSPRALIRRINEYFAQCDEDKEPYTISGLCFFLNLSRQGLVNYSEREDFIEPIRAAVMKLTQSLERRTILQGNSAGPIFLLKNLGFFDRHQHEVTGKDGEELKWEVKVVKATGDNETQARLPGVGSGSPVMLEKDSVKPAFKLVQTPELLKVESE